jgi:hypothetical protein
VADDKSDAVRIGGDGSATVRREGTRSTKSPSGLSFERRAQLLESEQERLRHAIAALEDLRETVDAERRQDVELTIARLKEAFEADAALTGHR